MTDQNGDDLALEDRSPKPKVSNNSQSEAVKLNQEDQRSSEVNSIVDLDSLSVSSSQRQFILKIATNKKNAIKSAQRALEVQMSPRDKSIDHQNTGTIIN